MNMNEFVIRFEGRIQMGPLVLPLSPKAAVPAKYKDGWNYYATVDKFNRMFGDIDAVAIVTEIAIPALPWRAVKGLIADNLGRLVMPSLGKL